MFVGMNGPYVWLEGHGTTMLEMLRAYPEAVTGKRALFYGSPGVGLTLPGDAEAVGWHYRPQLALSPPLATAEHLTEKMSDSVRALALVDRPDMAERFAALPSSAPIPPSSRNASLRDTAYLRDASPPPMWREDAAGWAAFVAETQRRFWGAIAALDPESFLCDGRACVLVTRDRQLYARVVDRVRLCEAADPVMATCLLDTDALVPLRQVLDIAVGPRDELAVLSSERPTHGIARRERARGVAHVRVRTPGPHRYRLDRLAGAAVTTLDLPETDAPLGSIQPLDAGRWLLVRDADRDEAGHNAYVHAADGRRLAAFSLGRGYNQVHATLDDQLWVGYDDEGVYKYGSFGQAGAVCLDLGGRPLLRFLDLARRHGLPAIDDCEAITVGDGQAIWLYYGSGYPLVRLVDGQFDRIWRDFPVSWARGFAVSGARVLLAGGDHSPDRLFLVDLATQKVRKLRPVDQHGLPIAFTSATGRGAKLYLSTARELFSIALESIE